MRKVDTAFLDCIEMCGYIEKKTMEKGIRDKLETDLFTYMVYICGRVNKEQASYINRLLNMEVKPGDVDFSIRQDVLLDGMQTFHLFLMSDRCFGQSDIKYHGKKAGALISLFHAAGDDLCGMCFEKDRQKAEGRMNTYLQKMNALLLSDASANEDSTVPDMPDDSKTLDELLDEFNSLTGLQSVKDEINRMINLVKVSKIREERGFKKSSVSKHMVFTGNPGTGKTTVARLLAGIYHKLGVLSKGQLIEVDRSGLVAGYTGQTAIKTGKVIEDAKGGILFIDEAYTLTEDKGEGDFGQEAVDTILKSMEDNRDDLIIIVAGYPDLMDGFLSSNPGLKSRFNKFINFEDYSCDELISIFKGMCTSMDYKVNPEDEKVLASKVESLLLEKNKSFANARTMRNMLESSVMMQASRIAGIEDIDDESLLTITRSDFEGYAII